MKTLADIMPAPTEDVLQEQVARYLDSIGLFWWHTPNNGAVGVRRGAKYKRHGVKAGIPDCLIYHKGCLYAIELKRAKCPVNKTPKGTLQKNQIEIHEKITQNGGKVAVCHTIGEVESALIGWGIK